MHYLTRRFEFALIPLTTLGIVPLCRAEDDVLYRAGDFGRAHSEMTGCSARMLVEPHPELNFLIDVEIPEGGSWSAGYSKKQGTVIWMILAKLAGGRRSHVELHNRGAKPEALEEVWQAIEKCANQ
jgi:hypothetical protein